MNLNEKNDMVISCVIAIIEKNIFAIDTKNILKLLKLEKLTIIPGSPAYVRGVINYNDEIIKVIDTRKLFHYPDFVNRTGKSSDSEDVIIISNRQNKYGIIVDSIVDIETLSDNLNIGNNISPYVESIISHNKEDNRLILKLNVNNLCNIN